MTYHTRENYLKKIVMSVSFKCGVGCSGETKKMIEHAASNEPKLNALAVRAEFNSNISAEVLLRERNLNSCFIQFF